MTYKEFCSKKYNEIFFNNYSSLLENSTSEAQKKKAERDAQKIAIKETLKQALSNYSPAIEAADLWHAIYIAHLKRKSGLSGLVDMDTIDEEVIEKVVSASQSWKKSSGHAFEAFIYEVANPSLETYGIKFLLQTDLHSMLEDGLIHNDSTDINWLKQRIQTDVFDLYSLLEFQRKYYVFGCIQSKTSIRDRVTRDREPSQQAMNAHFWSIAVALDGKFLAMPKFKEMVNGGGSDYEENGWHGMYVLSNLYTNDRIYPIDKTLSKLISHAQQASEAFLSARQRFSPHWRPANE